MMLVNIEKKSVISNKINSMQIEMTEDQYEEYVHGTKLVQNIFPNLDEDTREFLISGITPEEWNEVFGE